MFQCMRNVFTVAVVAVLLPACGGGVDAAIVPASAINGIAVDPYVVGATFCEDKNNDGACGAAEQVSSASDASGLFYFQDALTLGSDIVISTQGTHNGVAFTGHIKRNVDQADNLVVSPLTTLLANGWTAANVISVLQSSGAITGLTEADLKKDPLAGIEGLDAATLTADHLKIVKSTIATHSFLSIMQGVLTGPSVPEGGYNLSYAVFNSGVLLNGQTPQWYVDRMVDNIGGGLDPAILTDIDTVLTAASTACTGLGLPAAPPATAGDVIRGSAAIADYVIPKVVSDLTYSPTVVEYGLWRYELGLRFYLIRTRNEPCITAGIANGVFDPLLGEAFNTSWSSCRINSTSGQVECF